MWGLMFRIADGRVEASVPGWLTSAAASYACIDYMELCAQELARDPVRYGFDSENVYTVLIQTWDCALSATRSLAFGRNVSGHEAVRLIPDFYFLHHRGYSQLRHEATERPRWAERDPTLAWRGSITGRGPYERPEDIPRVRLALRCKAIAGTDVAVTGVHSTMEHVHSPERISAVVAENGLFSEGWHMAHFGSFKYVLDIDGHANAWAFLEKLILGSCVLKVESPYEQWFYHRLRPWVHYVPIKADLSDLEGRIAWCRDNEARCEWIADNSARLAAALTADAELQHSCEQIMIAAHVAPKP